MSQIDTEKIKGSEESQRQSEKLVDVSEAIRYRKRAQSAEQQQTLLQQQLAQRDAEIEKLNNSISCMTIEKQLSEKLIASGVRDLEAAVIIGKAKLHSDKQANPAYIVEQLKKEKSYLFEQNDFAVIAAATTSGVKNRFSGAVGNLQRAAKKAANTGSRKDLQEYLRTRRSFI